jgi:tetratricopeptide (TPR) repeat protein
MENTSRRTNWGAWAAIFVFAATFLGMSGICGHEFVNWDDPVTMYNNPRMNPATLDTLKLYWTHGEYGLYIPGTYTLWAGLAKIAHTAAPDALGHHLNPRVFHTASVLLHALAAMVMYLLLRRLLLSLFPLPVEDARRRLSLPPLPPGEGRGEGDCQRYFIAKINLAAAIGALIFGLHPVQVEAVAWASGMKDVLYGLFGLIALWQYVVAVQAESRGRFRVHFTMATLAFVWALLCKPTAMVLPAVAAVIDLLILRRGLWQVAKMTALWWPITFTWMIVARLAQPTFGKLHEQLFLRPLVAMDSLAFYLEKLVWPWKLCVDYGRTPSVAQDLGWLYWTWIVPVGVAAFVWWKGKRELAAAGLILVACVSPMLGLTPFLFQYYSTVSDHYLYLAMLGPALACAWLVARYPVMRAPALAVIGLLGIATIFQCRYWQDPQALYARTRAVNPQSFMAYNNLGDAYCEAGDIAFAMANLAEHGGDPATASADHAHAQEDFLQARGLFLKAVEIRKEVNRGIDDYFKAHTNLAAIYSRLHDSGQAFEQRKMAIAILQQFFPTSFAQRDLPELYCLCGQDLLVMNRPKDAIPYLDKALALNPSNQVAARARQKALGAMAKLPLD